MLLLCADAAGWRITGRCHRAKEVFGPVVSVTPFDNEEQVVTGRMTASTDLHLRYGRKMWAGASRQRTAAIWLYLGQYPFLLVSEMPHGGQKLSGYGKDMHFMGWRITPSSATSWLNIKLMLVAVIGRPLSF